MKILITTEFYKPTINGVVISCLNLKEELTKLGHQVKVLTLSETGVSFTKDDDVYIASIDAKIIYPGARFTLALSNNKYIKDIISWGPDIIHSQSEFSTFHIARHIAKKLNIPIIHTYHTIYEDYTHYISPVKVWGRAMAVRFTNLVLKKVDCVIAPTNKVENLLKSYGVQKDIKVIPTGIEISENNSLDKTLSIKEKLGIIDSEKVLISIGRLGKEKNHKELLEYVQKLDRKDIKLLIVGDGPYRESLEKTVVELGIEKQVIFTGMISHDMINDYYKLGDVFVSASNSETQGLTYFESLANGIPVLCRKDDCVKNVICDGVNGWQYEEYEEFKNYLNAMFEDNKEYWKHNTLNSVRHLYSSEAFAKNVETVYYENLIGSKYLNKILI